MTIRTLSLFLVLLLGGCASAPRQELQAARVAVAHADYYGAGKWAPEEFAKANEALREGEELVRQGDYQGARSILPHVEELARQAQTRADQKKAAFARAQKSRPQASIRKPKKDQSKTPPPAAAPEPVIEAPPPPLLHFTVEENQTLWMISARKDIYDDPLLWPLLYQANRDQIKDPRQIYPGQVLSIPRDQSAKVLEDAREKAVKSDIFPPDLFLKPLEPGKSP
ncbi:MAG: DUF4398 domain-containing protein [Desulfuromonadales bacterium]